MPSRQQRRHALRAPGPVLHALHRSLAGQAMAIFEELGSERDKANVMCLEANAATRRTTVSGCCASLCPLSGGCPLHQRQCQQSLGDCQ